MQVQGAQHNSYQERINEQRRVEQQQQQQQQQQREWIDRYIRSQSNNTRPPVISTLSEEYYQDPGAENCIDFACTLLAELEKKGVDVSQYRVVILENADDPTQPGHVGLLGPDNIFYDASGAHDFTEWKEDHPELALLTDATGALPRGDEFLSAMSIPPGDARDAALAAAGLSELADKKLALGPLLVLGVLAVAALLLSACSDPPPPPVTSTPTPTPGTPVFETVDADFVPLVKDTYLDAGGIQHRPIEVVIDRATYNNLVAMGRDPQEFVQAHVDAMNQMLRDAGVNMMLEVGAIRYVESMTDAQRGPWNVANSGNWPLTSYDPTKSAFWNAATGIDEGLLHEWGHSVLGLWDDYGFDVHAQDAANPLVPGTTLIYNGPDGLMSQTRPPFIPEWVVPLLNERAAANDPYRPHEYVQIDADNLPQTATLQLDPALAGQTITIHQGYMVNDTTKAMNPTPAITGTVAADGTFIVDPQSLFAAVLAAGNDQSHVSRTGAGTILIAVQTPSGPQYQWLNLADFVLARTQQGTNVVLTP
jgi:hypothetical protein